jgi:hypothetical protein
MKNTKPAKTTPRLIATFFALSWCAAVLPSGEATPTTNVTLTCSTPGNGGWCRGSETIAIQCGLNGFPFLSLSYQIDGGPFTTKTVNPYSFTYSLEGSHTVHAICHDSSLIDDDEYRSFQIDQTAPSVTTSKPLLVVGGDGYDVTITVTDAVSGLTGTLKVEEYETAIVESWTSVGEPAVSGASASVTIPRAPGHAGRYCYRVTVSDVAGNALEGELATSGLTGNACVTYEPVA